MTNGKKRWGLLIWVLGLLADSLVAGINAWPLIVAHKEGTFFADPQVQLGGPLFVQREGKNHQLVTLRPLWTRYTDMTREDTRTHILYPFYNRASGNGFERGHVLNLLRWSRVEERPLTLELFPFFFLKDSVPQRTLALWPLGGTLHNRFGRDRIDFALWPAYVRTRRDSERRDHYLYPFIRTLSGPESRGWGVWPLWGEFEKDGDYHHRWALWPIYYDYKDKLDEAVPYRRMGILPFYARETGEGLYSETWGWPFFGYTREEAPRVAYFEWRYFWPFWVQGSGDEREVERWLPLFARESGPGYTKRWWLWPLLKTEEIEMEGRLRERQTALYFLYRNERQALSEGEARLNTLWPLWGYWQDGAGRRQFRMLDPLTVFFPSNPVVKDTWSPLFSLMTYEERSGQHRVSLLWDLCVWESGSEKQSFQLGPLFSWDKGREWSVLGGLLGHSHSANGTGWTLFWNQSSKVADSAN
jgi:hypothetical protein